MLRWRSGGSSGMRRCSLHGHRPPKTQRTPECVTYGRSLRMPDRPFAEVAMTLRVLDLFSGIGAFSLGLERAGMRTVAFCECDPYCRRVLKRHWPEVPCYDDIRTLTAARLARDGLLATDASDTENDGRTGGTWCGATGQWLVSSVKASGGWQADRAGEPCRRGIDVICGGFPCQDISVAGRGDGIDGERSGLWSEYARLIGELRPRYAIVENVAALVVRGLERVVGDLAALGYDAEWRIISAADMGAPHLRERIWIVAYPSGDGCDAGREGASGHVWHAQPSVGALREPGIWAAGGTDDVADADGDDTERRRTATHAGNGGESDAARLRQPARGSGADDVA